MVDFLTSDKVKDFLSFAFKRGDIEDKRKKLYEYLIKNFKTENASLYRTRAGGRDFVYTSNYKVNGDKLLINDSNDLELLKLPVIYMYKIEPDLMSKSSFRPENIFSNLDWKGSALRYKPFTTGDINDFLNVNRDMGCTYSEEDIAKHYVGESAVRLSTLYRICNSLGRLIDVKSLEDGSVRGFDIKSSERDVAITEGLTMNKLFLECVSVFKKYLELNNSQAGMAKILVNRKIFKAFLDSLISRGDLTLIADNPLVIAKFMSDFSGLTEHSRGFQDNYNAVMTLSKPFQKFLKDVFQLSVVLNESKLFVNLPKSDVSEVVSDMKLASDYVIMSGDYLCLSNSNTLPDEADKYACECISKFFESKVNASFDVIQDSLLMIFGKYTTNLKRLKLPTAVSFTIKDQTVSFRMCDLWSSVTNKVCSKFKDLSGCNIIRMWANNRAARAMKLFRVKNFSPGLFSYVPGILPYMRFDFFKAIPLQDMSQEEVESFRTLRLMTESRSNRSEQDEIECEQWILRS